uniref:Uncharacterized protein n=2 Tax=Lepeophtheirus salmonis TaxID=72036 RepID=A0A0K2UE79_LEPSM
MFLSAHKCPWEIDFTYKDRAYFFGKMEYNIWNPIGNGWKPEEKINLKCFYPERYPNPSFCCSVLNVTSNNRVLQYHPEKIGIYRKISRPDKLNFQLPVFKMDGKEFYLYSHHPLGRLWLIGSTYVSWSLRLNLIHNRHLDSYYCPEEPLLQDSRWEYLYSTNNNGDQIWLKDGGFKIKCLEY